MQYADMPFKKQWRIGTKIAEFEEVSENMCFTQKPFRFAPSLIFDQLNRTAALSAQPAASFFNDVLFKIN